MDLSFYLLSPVKSRMFHVSITILLLIKRLIGWVISTVTFQLVKTYYACTNKTDFDNDHAYCVIESNIIIGQFVILR